MLVEKEDNKNIINLQRFLYKFHGNQHVIDNILSIIDYIDSRDNKKGERLFYNLYCGDPLVASIESKNALIEIINKCITNIENNYEFNRINETSACGGDRL